MTKLGRFQSWLSLLFVVHLIGMVSAGLDSSRLADLADS